MSNYKELESRVIAWAHANPDVRAILVIGSRASIEYHEDSYSDLDLIVFSSHAKNLLSNRNWLLEIEDVWIAYLSQTAHDHPEWFVLFQGGLKADFVIIDVDSQVSITELLVGLPYQDTFQKGLRVLFNRIDSENDISIALENHTPSPTEFSILIDKILMQCTRITAFISREELWQSQIGMERLRQLILELIAVHSRISGGIKSEIWYDGRFINQWAAPWILDNIAELFPGYSSEEISKALVKAPTIVDRLAIEIASTMKIEYPTPGQRATMEWLSTIWH